MLIDADHAAQDGLQMDMVDSFDLCWSENQDVQIYNPTCKTAEWTVDDEERYVQNNTRLSCLDSGYGGGFSPREFEYDLQINPMCNLDLKGQELSILGSQETQRRIFHHDQVNYYSQSNIPEDHFSQFAPCMMTNPSLSVNNQQPDCVGSSHILDHQLENHNWDQELGKGTYRNYSQSVTHQHLMSGDTNMRNADMNKTHNRTGSHLQCTIMDESFYDKGESCSYSKFRGNQSSHNFEGVARSFPATIHKTHPTPIPTPPLDDDWLFSNIVAEVRSMTSD